MDSMVVMGKHIGALMGRIAEVVAFFNLGRVGALFSLLFLQHFQPHVLQVCFLLLQCFLCNAFNLFAHVFRSHATF